MEYKHYQYKSALSPYIRSFLEEKRALGFLFNGMAYQLHRLDQYWELHQFSDVRMSAERLDDWIKALPREGKSSHRSRICAVRSLGRYLASLGLNTYVPVNCIRGNHPVIHILSKSEIQELFTVIDNYFPYSKNKIDYRLANEYPIIFRLYYCCGMRNNEVCSLKTQNIDLEDGIITVLNGKNQKGRLVYIPADLLKLIRQYYHWLVKELGYHPIWFFPGRIQDKHITAAGIDKKFNDFWNKTSASKSCERAPTPHCLRHTFVVDRINLWILSGVNLSTMSSYLSKYLGHNDWNETFYYYHLVDDAFKIIKSKDTVSTDVIPEVRRI